MKKSCILMLSIIFLLNSMAVDANNERFNLLSSASSVRINPKYTTLLCFIATFAASTAIFLHSKNLLNYESCYKPTCLKGDTVSCCSYNRRNLKHKCITLHNYSTNDSCDALKAKQLGCDPYSVYCAAKNSTHRRQANYSKKNYHYEIPGGKPAYNRALYTILISGLISVASFLTGCIALMHSNSKRRAYVVLR